MESINNEIKQHRKKIHDFELADIKTKEKEERQKKEIKSKEERIASLESQIKQKVEDFLAQG
jgi:flagellar motility protein MotE (MotC chaperone)